MNKAIVRMGSLLLLLPLLTGCGKDQAKAAPTAAPAESPVITAAPDPVPVADAPAPADQQAEPEAERILGYCTSIVDALPYSADLDGDGVAEVVNLVTYVPEDEYPRWTVTVTKDSVETQFETDIPYDTAHDLWVGDLDEDGAYEIFFHGDMASDDYLIYGFRSDLGSLFFAPDERAVRWEDPRESTVFAGRIEGFEDGHIVIEGAVDMLGTHWGVRNFSLGEDGIIGPASTVWTFDDEIEAERPLTVAKELTAYAAAVRKDPGQAFTLKPGEKIYPLASDGCERMWFETEQGKGGVLLLTPDEADTWRIDGAPEASFFENLPYSG